MKGHASDKTLKIVAIITRHLKIKQRFSFLLTEYFKGTFFG